MFLFPGNSILRLLCAAFCSVSYFALFSVFAACFFMLCCQILAFIFYLTCLQCFLFFFLNATRVVKVSAFTVLCIEFFPPLNKGNIFPWHSEGKVNTTSCFTFFSSRRCQPARKALFCSVLVIYSLLLFKKSLKVPSWPEYKTILFSGNYVWQSEVIILQDETVTSSDC